MTIDLEAKTVAKAETKSDDADPEKVAGTVDPKDEAKAKADVKASDAAKAEKTAKTEETGKTATVEKTSSADKGDKPDAAGKADAPKGKSDKAADKPDTVKAATDTGPGGADAKSEARPKPGSAKAEDAGRKSQSDAPAGRRPAAAAATAASRASSGSAAVKPQQLSSLPLIAAAVIGGIVSLGGAIGLDRAGLINLGQPPAGESEALSALEASVASLSGALDGFRSDIEAKIGEFSAAAGDSAALGQQIDGLKAEIAAISKTTAPDLEPLQSRMTKIETLMESGGAGVDAGLEALQAKLTAAVQRIDALSADLSTLTKSGEARSSDIDAGLEAMQTKLADAATEVETLGKTLASLAEGGRARSAGITAVEERLTSRIDGFEAALKDLGARTDLATARAGAAATADQIKAANEASQAASRKADQAVAIAPVLAAEALQRAMEAGQPLDSALNAFASLGVSDPALDALKPYAETGLPTMAMLKSEFDGLAAGFAASPGTPDDSDAGAVDRLLKGAFGVVKVRPADEAGTAGPGAAGKVSEALAAGDLNRALDEWQNLPDDHKQASQAWADKAGAILNARQFAETVRTDALARLAVIQ